MNERIYESEMPTFTTDVRMEKVPQIFATGAGHGDKSQSQGSGGGGPVEAVFWIKDVNTQWRMKGEAFVIDRDIEGPNGDPESSGVRTVKSEVGKRMRLVKDNEGRKESEWSWARELTAHFGNVSPGMRGTWRNPPPGTPTQGGKEPDEEHKLGQKIDDLEDPIARSNFRVVVIRPESVEQLDLTDPETARRWRYDFVEVEGEEGRGEWKVEELWP